MRGSCCTDMDANSHNTAAHLLSWTAKYDSRIQCRHDSPTVAALLTVLISSAAWFEPLKIIASEATPA